MCDGLCAVLADSEPESEEEEKRVRAGEEMWAAAVARMVDACGVAHQLAPAEGVFFC